MHTYTKLASKHGANDLAIKFPEVAATWHPTRVAGQRTAMGVGAGGQRGRQMNVGVDAWGGRPVAESEIAELVLAGPADLGPLAWKGWVRGSPQT